MKQAFNKNSRIYTPIKPAKSVWLRVALYVTLLLVLSAVCIFAYFVAEGKSVLFYQSPQSTTQEGNVVDVVKITTFPHGVVPSQKKISEDPSLNEFVGAHLAPTDGTLSMSSDVIQKIIGKLALLNVYQNLASLSSRVLVIVPGERKEEVASHFAKILGWNTQEEATFLSLIQDESPALDDGKFFPGTYSVNIGASPEEVATLVVERFTTEVLSRYSADIESVIPLSDTLILASLIEREARDFDDMRHISGVIWNRLFVDMRLQIDATLQYVKGTQSTKSWWPRVVPSDKYLASAYNTYKNKGLPPTPIANPSLESIIAALNPKQTDCLFYFHDKKGGFHCTKTYEEHVVLLKQYYGKGK